MCFRKNKFSPYSKYFSLPHLGYDGERRPEPPQSELRDGLPINVDGPPGRLDYPEQGEGERGLSRPRPTHYTDLLAGGHLAVDALQHQVQALAVAGLQGNGGKGSIEVCPTKQRKNTTYRYPWLCFYTQTSEIGCHVGIFY